MREPLVLPPWKNSDFSLLPMKTSLNGLVILHIQLLVKVIKSKAWVVEPSLLKHMLPSNSESFPPDCRVNMSRKALKMTT